MTASVGDRPARVQPDAVLELPDNPRAGRRRVLYLVGLLPLLVALAFTVKVVAMRHHDDAGSAAWRSGDGVTALEAYDANRSVNLLQPWLAPFDAGDAAFLLGDYPRARGLFTSALGSVPHRQECTVRINLALADEAIGDAASEAGRRDDATDAWRAGISVLDEGDCPQHAGLGQKQSHDAATVRSRLEKKLTPPPPQPQPKQPQSGRGTGQSQQEKQQQEKKQQELQQRNDSGSRDHQRAQDFGDDEHFGNDYSW